MEYSTDYPHLYFYVEEEKLYEAYYTCRGQRSRYLDEAPGKSDNPKTDSEGNLIE